jgi:hypothetical protein
MIHNEHELLTKRVRCQTDKGWIDGEIIDWVTVYVVITKKGIVSLDNAEEKPTEEQLAKVGGVVVSTDNDAKIRLDTGEIVYGCQVWWEPIRNLA